MDNRLAEYYRRAKIGHASKLFFLMADRQVFSDTPSIKITVKSNQQNQTKVQT